MLENTMSALIPNVVAEYASMNPLVVYEDDAGKLTVAILEGVKGANTTRGDAEKMRVRKQGVRKGEVGYKAKATIAMRPLVPVLAFIEEALVDGMLISPTALAMGKAAVDALNPRINPLVDTLVEEYEESAPLEREFFLPQDGEEEFMDTIISAVELSSEGEAHVGEITEPQHIMDPVPQVESIAIDTQCHTTVSEEVPTLEPGLVEGGELVGFDPEVHIVP